MKQYLLDTHTLLWMQDDNSTLSTTVREILEISALNILKKLPFIHRDPFDRIIVSTAIDMNFNLITKDLNLHKYEANTIW